MLKIGDTLLALEALPTRQLGATLKLLTFRFFILSVFFFVFVIPSLKPLFNSEEGLLYKDLILNFNIVYL